MDSPHDDVLYIVNPVAGGGRGRRVWDSVEARLVSGNVPYSVRFTGGRGDGTAMTAAALREGVRRIVSVGGDGTAQEVVNGFFEGDRPISPEARVAFLPGGTGNDAVRALPRGDSPSSDDGTVLVDLLRIRNDASLSGTGAHYGLFHAGVGLVTEVVETSNQLRGRLGPLVYAGGSAVALLRHRPSRIRYSIDDGPFTEEEINLVVVGNGPYAGGGMKIAPSASMEDGLLDIVTMRGASRGQMLFRLLPSVYRGRHLGHPAVGYVQAHQIRIESDTPLSVQIDGEIEGTTPVSIDVFPRALPVWLSPPGA